MQIEKHHAVCPEAEVDCPYKQYGCHVKVLFYTSLSVPGLGFVSQTVRIIKITNLCPFTTISAG